MDLDMERSREIYLELSFDGSCRPNPGQGACGCACYLTKRGVILDPAAFPLFSDCQKLGLATSNIAEYMGLITGLRRIFRELPAIDISKYVHVHVLGDSQIVINQLIGSYNTNNAILRNLRAVADGLLKRFASVEFTHVPRENNEEADRLAGDAQMSLTMHPLSYIQYNPSTWSLRCYVSGRAEMMRVSHDAGKTTFNPEILIDSRFLASLRYFDTQALESLADPAPWTTVLASTTHPAVKMTVLGVLIRTLTISLYMREEDHMPITLGVCNAVVVVDLPVPLHISVNHPDLRYSGAFRDIEPELGSNKLTADRFPLQYQEHPYWNPGKALPSVYYASGY